MQGSGTRGAESQPLLDCIRQEGARVLKSALGFVWVIRGLSVLLDWQEGKGERRTLTREEENLLALRILKGGIQLGRERRPLVPNQEGALHQAALGLGESPVPPGNGTRGRGNEPRTEHQWAGRRWRGPSSRSPPSLTPLRLTHL